MEQVKFVEALSEAKIISKIAKRAVQDYAKHGIEIDRISTEMDVSAVHANGNPLRLEELLEADEYNFAHDISGIARHLDRETGKLRDCFLPRYSK